jgi:hypothetical protein
VRMKDLRQRSHQSHGCTPYAGQDKKPIRGTVTEDHWLALNDYDIWTLNLTELQTFY